MTPPRSDAVRSRERILDVAQNDHPDGLRFNRIASAAGVGVGTVYRHFPTVHALKEALAERALADMVEVAREAEAETDAGQALRAFIGSALRLQVSDGRLHDVLLSPADESDQVRAMKRDILSAFGSVLERARAAGEIRSDVTIEGIQHLICGVEHAVRLGGGRDIEVFLDVLLSGLRC